MAQPPEVTQAPVYYKSFEHFKACVRMLKLTAEWQIVENEGWIRVFNNNKHVLPLPPFEIFIDQSLSFFIRVFGWRILDEHSVFAPYENSVKNITLSNIIAVLKQYKLCPGISNQEVINSPIIEHHCISLIYTQNINNSPLQQTMYDRSSNCEVLLKNEEICLNCKTLETNISSKTKRAMKRQADNLVKPAKLNAPISLTSPDRIKLTL